MAPEIPVRIEGRDVVAILDSGSMVTSVGEQMVTSTTLLPDEVAMSCVHGGTHYYPTVSLSILNPKGRCTVRAGKVPQLIVPLLIRRDCPLYKELRQMTLRTGQRGSGLSITRQEPGHRRGAGKQREKKTKSEPEVVALTRKQSLGLWSNLR